MDNAIATKRVNPNNLLFASKELISSIAEVERTAGLIQTNPNFEFIQQRLEKIKQILEVNMN